MNKDIFKNKSILITGGTGSFGKNFIKYAIKNFSAKKLVIFSRDELKQYEMQSHKDFKSENFKILIGDMSDLERLKLAVKDMDIVVHAAALKQVPTAEYNRF